MKKKIIFILFILGILGLAVYFANIKPNKKTEEIKEANVEQTTNNNNVEVQKEEIPEMKKINNERKALSEISTTRGLPVLMYHFFYDESAGETARDNNCMEIKNFEAQIKYLAENNYYVPEWEEVIDFVNGKIGLPEKSVIITVDDGDESFFRLAVPVLKKYKFYATSFVVTSWYSQFVTEENAEVVDFQSHSDNMHRSGKDGKGAILTLSYDEVCKDLETCRAIIGEKCRVFCYPFGHYNENAMKELQDCNYIAAFTVEGGRVTPGMNCLKLPRVRMSKGDTLNSFINKVK